MTLTRWLPRATATDDCCDAKASELEALARVASRRRVLYAVLVINLVMFAVEFGAGLLVGSAALLADSTDMLGDAMVYGISIAVVAKGLRWRAAAATVKGVVILAFGVVVLVQAFRALTGDASPDGIGMSVFGAIALAANLVCLRLLWGFRGDDINMSSTFECSRNDVIANSGVILSGGLVAATGSAWPDIAVALAIGAIFMRSAFGTLRSSVPQLRGGEEAGCGCEPGCACCAA